LNTAANTVDYPRGVEVLESVAEALMKLFGESLAVNRRVDTDAILATVASTITKQVPVTCVAILMKSDPGTSRIVVADQVNPAVARYIEGYVATMLRPGEAPTTGLSQRVIESGSAVFMPGIHLEQFLSLISAFGRGYHDSHPFPIDFDSASILMVPMRSGPATLGTLALFDWYGKNALSEKDVDWMQRVADRTGLSADNAILRTRAIDRVERLAALSDVALAITSGQDLRLTLKLIIERVIATLGVDAADMLLLDDGDTTLFVAANAGFRSVSPADSRFPIPPEVARHALLEHTIGSQGAVDWIGQSRRWVVAREGFKSYMASTLTAREKLVGVLEVFSRAPHEPDSEWLSFLDTMASQAAIAIDNATAHDLVRRAGQPHASRKLPAPTLSGREREILNLVIDGASNRDVAEKLHLSQNTIKFHIRQLLEKAEVANRTELATKAVQQGWL
jgi:DNA-binding CsgD family transcriptional regulator